MSPFPARGAPAPAPPWPRADRTPPPLRACATLAAGTYRLGEPGEERPVTLAGALIGRWPVVNAHVRDFVRDTGRRVAPELAARLASEELADHPATGLTFAQAEAFCAWAGGRLPTGAEWEAAARGQDGRRWPWGDAFGSERCACAEAGAGWTASVRAHPDGASACGAEQLAGNVWEWVAGPPGDDGWRAVRGGCWLDHAWGLRASRALAADPARATPTTGLRIAFDQTTEAGREP